MKFNLIILILLQGLIIFGQHNVSEKLIGTWKGFDEYNKEHKIIVAKSDWTYDYMWAFDKAKTNWKNYNITGKYQILPSKKIHIIYHDRPREQGFAKVIYVDDKKLIIIMGKNRRMKNVEKYEFTKY